MEQQIIYDHIPFHLELTMTPRMGANCKDPADTTMAADLANIVRTHALGAAAAGLGVAWLPGFGATAALVTMTGFVWTMYLRINDRMGLRLSKVVLKTLASAFISNLAQNTLSYLGITVLSTILSFTGVGNIAAAALMAAMDYAIVKVGGALYLKLINGLMSAGKVPEEMSEQEITTAMDTVMDQSDVGSMISEASQEYIAGKKDGTITGTETVELEPEDA